MSGADAFEDFRGVRVMGGLSRQAAADLLRVTLRTICNWETGRARPPYSALELLRVKTGQVLPSPGWDGWTLVNGGLVSPVGDLFEARSLEWLSLTFEMAREFQRRNCTFPEPTWPDDSYAPSQIIRSAMAAPSPASRRRRYARGGS